MTTKMKGLLKGLRYISQIFESADDKEPEMQIGYPTDVKHVAHIGWDGPSVSSPSWMNEFKSSTPDIPSGPIPKSSNNREAKPKTGKKLPCQDSSSINRIQGSSARDLPELPKPSRQRQTNAHSSLELGGQTSPDLPRRSRRNHTANATIETPLTELSIDSPWRSSPSIPKQSRRKKTKEKEKGSPGNGGSNKGGGSTRSRAKPQDASAYVSPFSDPGVVDSIPGINNDLPSALRGRD